MSASATAETIQKAKHASRERYTALIRKHASHTIETSKATQFTLLERLVSNILVVFFLDLM
jgi:uncharacterized protein YchJ